MESPRFIDPTRAMRAKLAAVAIAALLLTTEALITDEKTDKPAPAGAAGMGGMDY